MAITDQIWNTGMYGSANVTTVVQLNINSIIRGWGHWGVHFFGKFFFCGIKCNHGKQLL